MEALSAETIAPSIVLTVEEAAKLLKIGRTSMYALVMSGEVESVMIGRLRRVPTDAISGYINHLRHPAAAAA